MKQLLGKAAALTITENETATLASRLARLDQQLTAGERTELETVAGMPPLTTLVRSLVDAVDVDHQAEAHEIARQSNPPEVTFDEALRELVINAIAPLAGNPDLRQRILAIRASHDLVIDEISVDVLLDAGGSHRH